MMPLGRLPRPMMREVGSVEASLGAAVGAGPPPGGRRRMTVAGIDPVRVGDLRVVRPHLRPTPGVAVIARRQIPERVALLHHVRLGHLGGRAAGSDRRRRRRSRRRRRAMPSLRIDALARRPCRRRRRARPRRRRVLPAPACPGSRRAARRRRRRRTCVAVVGSPAWSLLVVGVIGRSVICARASARRRRRPAITISRFTSIPPSW